MNVDRSIGVLGLIVTLFGIGAAILWPTKRWVGICAIAAGVLIVIVWGITMFSSASAKTAPNEVYSGVVLDQSNRKPIADADILVAQNQAVPEVIHSDNHGVFVVRLHPGVIILKINVSANGYVPELRTTAPTRTGTEEFELKPVSKAAMSGHPVNPKAHSTDSPEVTNRPSQPAQTVISEGNQGPSIGINNGTANFYLGNPPPPIRNVNPKNVSDAIATLRVAVEGTKIRIDGVGESPDLESFVNQFMRLFQLGGWASAKGVRTKRYEVNTFTSSGLTTSHGEGISCFSENPNVAFIAKRALEQIGYPCLGNYTPEYAERFPADFYLSIGEPTN